jgi:hypothetical protein
MAVKARLKASPISLGLASGFLEPPPVPDYPDFVSSPSGSKSA